MSTSEVSPKTKARMAGAFYLATILTGLFAQGYISERLVVAGDSAATALNILANESLFRLGFAVYLVEMTCQIVMTSFFYDLFRPVSRSVSFLAALIGLSGCVIKTVSRVFFFTPLIVLGGAHWLNDFTPSQLKALALLFLKVNDQGAAIALVFFGLYALLKGWLILKSTFLPGILGAISMIAGLGWIAFLFPPVGYRFFPIIAGLGLLGSLANIGWLLVVGVDDERWLEQARVASTSIWS